jgi:RNA polymerase sigma-70 factor (family 1)
MATYILSEEVLLVKEFRRGRTSAFEEIFSRYYNALCYFLKLFIKDPEVCKDIVSETFTTLWKMREQFDNINSIRSFLYTSAKNAALNHIQRQKVIEQHRKNAVPELNREELDDVIMNKIFDAEVLRAVYLAIDTLPPQCKRIVQLSLQGFKTDAIAAQLGLSPQTIRNTKVRATDLLRKRLAGDILALSLMTVLLAGI